MLAPASASLRCLNALRYLVLSYVTRPTTISAMTEMPANTPNPIGRTEIFLPGNSKGAVDAEGAESAADVPAAAAAPETSVDEGVTDAESAADVVGLPALTTGDTVADADGVGVVATEGTMVETSDAAMDEKPYERSLVSTKSIIASHVLQLTLTERTGAPLSVGEAGVAAEEVAEGGITVPTDAAGMVVSPCSSRYREHIANTLNHSGHTLTAIAPVPVGAGALVTPESVAAENKCG